MRFKVVIISPDSVGSRLLTAARVYGNIEPIVLADFPDEGDGGGAVLREADAVVLHVASQHVPIGEACRRARSLNERPLLVLAPAQSSGTCVEALNAGADDCLQAGDNEREVWVRLRAQLRRVHEYTRAGADSTHIEAGELSINTDSHDAAYAARPLELTPKEFELLVHLARNAGRAISRAELLRELWGLKPGMDSRTLDVHIGRLRAKLGGDSQHPCPIVTVSGVGYKYVT